MNISSAHQVWWILGALLPVSGLAAAGYCITSRPLHREERARFLLDLIESALAQGKPVEQYMVSLAQTRDATLGTRFYLWAAYREQGRSRAGHGDGQFFRALKGWRDRLHARACQQEFVVALAICNLGFTGWAVSELRDDFRVLAASQTIAKEPLASPWKSILAKLNFRRWKRPRPALSTP